MLTPAPPSVPFPASQPLLPSVTVNATPLQTPVATPHAGAIPIGGAFAPAGYSPPLSLPSNNATPTPVSFTFTPPAYQPMVSLSQASLAVQLAAERTAKTYEAELEAQREQQVRASEQIEALRIQVQQERSRACTLEDELTWFRDTLEESHTELALLKSESSNARNFLIGMQKEAALESERSAKQQLEAQLLKANARIASLLDPDDRHASQVMPQSMVLEGEELRAKLTTKASARVALAGASVELATELTPQHVNRLAQHVEAVIFGVGRGDLERTQLLLAAVLDRPCVQRVLASGAP